MTRVVEAVAAGYGDSLRWDKVITKTLEGARRWQQLADTYLAQQIAFYPPEYFGEETSPDQMLETVERYEEDLTDQVHIHRPLHAVVEVGDPIEVSPTRERGVELDPVIARMREQLEAITQVHKRIVARDPERMPQFLAWFERWFLRRATPVDREES